MKGKDSFKGMPSWKGKGKGDGKNKGGKPFQQQQPPQANVAQQASSSSSASQAREKTRKCPSRRKLELRLWHLLDRWLVNIWILLWIWWRLLPRWLVQLVLLCFRWGTDLSRGQALRRFWHLSWGRTDGPKQPVLFFGHLLVPTSRTQAYANHFVHVFVRVSAAPALFSFEQELNSEHPICWREHCNRFQWHAFEWTAHLPTPIR